MSKRLTFPIDGKNLAFKAQAEMESAVLRLAEKLREATNSANLCLAGGIALDSVANGLIAGSGLFERVFIQPAANDAGQAIGLAYDGYLRLCELPEKASASPPAVQPLRSALKGRTYQEQEIQNLLDATGLPYTLAPDRQSLADSTADDLAAGRVIGWLQGERRPALQPADHPSRSQVIRRAVRQ